MKKKLRLSTHIFTEFSSTQYFPIEHSAEVEEKEHSQSLSTILFVSSGTHFACEWHVLSAQQNSPEKQSCVVKLEHWQSLTKEVVPSAAVQTFLSQTKNKKKKYCFYTEIEEFI